MSGGILVYCHGKPAIAVPLGDGWYRCACGKRFQIACPADDQIAEAA